MCKGVIEQPTKSCYPGIAAMTSHDRFPLNSILEF
jgi:hypothetical protein